MFFNREFMIGYCLGICFQLIFWLVKIVFWLICGVFYWIFDSDSFKTGLVKFLTVAGVELMVWGGIELYNYSGSSKPKNKSNIESVEGTVEYVCIANEFINIRVSPNTKAAVLGKVNRGESVYVYEVNNGFAKVKYGSGIGYANAKFIAKKKR